MAKMNMHQRKRFEDQVHKLRKMINRTPRWYPREIDGHPVMVEDGEKVVLRFEGQWAPTVAELFTHLTHDVGLHLIGLLEATPGTAAESHAVTFLAALRLEDDDTRR
jgi:hypothetical protein